MAEWACPFGSAVGEFLVGPSVVFEAVVGSAECCEVVRDGGSAFCPCGGVVEVAVCGRHATSREHTGPVASFYFAAL